MEETKNPLLSKTILGIIVSAIGFYLQPRGIEVDSAQVVNMLDEALVVGGMVFATYGRMKAKSSLAFKKKAE